MSSPKKPTLREELDRIRDALVETILDADGAELREEIAAAGGDPDGLVAETEAVIASARAGLARRRLESARAELKAWRARSGPAEAAEREEAQARLQRLLSGPGSNADGMSMAARKGKELSESDLEGLLEDLAELARLEQEDGKE